jgi:hypothetical protein
MSSARIKLEFSLNEGAEIDTDYIVKYAAKFCKKVGAQYPDLEVTKEFYGDDLN